VLFLDEIKADWSDDESNAVLEGPEAEWEGEPFLEDNDDDDEYEDEDGESEEEEREAQDDDLRCSLSNDLQLQQFGLELESVELQCARLEVRHQMSFLEPRRQNGE
jgi:hypothetical protein